MIQEHVYRGAWWLPRDETEQLTGTLTVTNGAAALDLLGHFGRELLSETARFKTYSDDLAEQSRIVGISTDGKAITLERNRALSHIESFPGIPIATYHGDVALIGKHFADGEEVAFDEISIRASDLNEWAQVSGFNCQIGMENYKDTQYLAFSNVAIRFDAPDDIDIALAGGERAFIRFTGRSTGLGRGTSHIALDQEAALHLRFSKRTGLAEIFDRVGQIRNFLSLAVGRPVAVLSVTGYQDDYVRERSGVSLPVDVLWRIPQNPDVPTRLIHPSEMFFTLPEVTPDISSVMKKWFARQSRLRPVFNLYFGNRYQSSTYLEVRFLAYAQAIETYDFRRRRKPEKKTLAQRMEDVLGECRTVSARIIGDQPSDQDAFIETFKNARNYYTHYNPKLEKKAARGAALLLLSLRLQAIIEMSLLRELGFGCRSIGDILQRGRRYAQIEHFKAVVAKGENDEP